MARVDQAANKTIVRRFVEEFKDQHRVETVNELVSRDFVNHSGTVRDIPGMERATGVEGMKEIDSMYRKSFPQQRVTIRDMALVYGRERLVGPHLVLVGDRGLFPVFRTRTTRETAAIVSDDREVLGKDVRQPADACLSMARGTVRGAGRSSRRFSSLPGTACSLRRSRGWDSARTSSLQTWP